VLSAAVGVEHLPVLMSHVPDVWQVAGVPQDTKLPPTQDPFWHVSVCVQALPSLQVVPFVALVGEEQTPVE